MPSQHESSMFLIRPVGEELNGFIPIRNYDFEGSSIDLTGKSEFQESGYVFNLASAVCGADKQSVSTL